MNTEPGDLRPPAAGLTDVEKGCTNQNPSSRSVPI